MNSQAKVRSSIDPADQTVLELDPKSYAAFVALLDAPSAPNERLRNTMRTLSP